MTLLQDDRLIRIATHLGENAFVVLAFNGTEKISGLFSFDLLLASEKNDITFEQLAGRNATVVINSSDGDKRFFNGIITSLNACFIIKDRKTERPCHMDTLIIEPDLNRFCMIWRASAACDKATAKVGGVRIDCQQADLDLKRRADA